MVRVAACQLDTRQGRVQENVDLALQVAARAAAAGARYLLCHENMVHEYPPDAPGLAEPVPGPVTDRFAAFCARHRVNLAFGMTVRAQPRPLNAAVFITAGGEVAAVYAKRSLVGRAGYQGYLAPLEGRQVNMDAFPWLLEDQVFQAGSQHLVLDWDGLRAGALICADTGRDDYWQAIRDLGAAVLFCPFNNPGIRLYHPRLLDQVRQWGLHFVGANRAGCYPMDLPGRGQSLIAGPDGQVLADAGAGVNTFISADLPLGA